MSDAKTDPKTDPKAVPPGALPSRDPGPEGAVHLDVDGAVASVIFDRPQARNAMTWAMYEGLARACEAIARTMSVRVAVLRGTGGKAFVAGTDIGQFAEFGSGEDGVAYEARIEGFVGRLAALEVPTVAAVEGWAVGGGLAIATACDFRVATVGARFGAPIARTLGNCLSTSSLRLLTAALGLPTVQRMVLLADLVPAEELEHSGYVLRTVKPEALEATLDDLCTRLAGYAPITMATTKVLLGRLVAGSTEPDEALLRRCYGSEDFGEGVAAFVAKRPARWQGR